MKAQQTLKTLVRNATSAMFQNKKLKRNATSANAEGAEVALCPPLQSLHSLKNLRHIIGYFYATEGFLVFVTLLKSFFLNILRQ